MGERLVHGLIWVVLAPRSPQLGCPCLFVFSTSTSAAATPAACTCVLPPPQIFMLNGALDRETSCCPQHSGPMTAADMVQATAGGAGAPGLASQPQAPGRATADVAFLLCVLGPSILAHS